MKIAIVIDVYKDKGNGTSRSAQYFVEQLEKRGHEIVVLCVGKEKGQFGNEFHFENINIPIYQKICEQQHAILAKPDDKLIYEAIKNVDVVHIYMPFWLGTHTAKMARLLNKPVLGCYHISAENLTYNSGLHSVPFSEDMVYLGLKNHHYKNNLMHDIFCPSECIANRIRKYNYKQNLHIISNGYDKEFHKYDVIKPEKYKGKKIIISVGRLTKEKRQELIIKAIGKSAYKDKIVLILAGKGAQKEKYEKLAQKFGVDLEIVFLSKNELIETLNYADLFVQASDVETESISCLEAIACGVVPIISNADMCATKQFALVGESLFDKGDSKSLQTKIDYWFLNEKILKSMKNNYAESAKKYNMKKSIDSIEKVYCAMVYGDKQESCGKVINYNKDKILYNGYSNHRENLFRHFGFAK